MKLTNSQNLEGLEKPQVSQKKVIPCEVYSRVVGYYRPVHDWNDGKRQEFKDRVTFTEEASLQNPKAKADIPTITANEKEALEQFYKIFTMPNCEKCEEVKSFLEEKNLPVSVFDLKSPEGNKEFRNYYSKKSIKDRIKRDHDGALKLPIVFYLKKDSVVETAQGLDEVKTILA